MMITMAVAFAATLLSVESHPPTIECFVGDEVDYWVESGFTYCKSHHTGSNEFHLTGHHGRSDKRDFVFQNFTYARITHGCALEFDNTGRIESKCSCITNQCNSPKMLAEQLKKRFIELMGPLKLD